MKRLVLMFLICLCPLTALSHPGKTDRYGGHKCLKGCEAWGLFYEEYHLHDKDWKPIRVSRKNQGPPEAELRNEAGEAGTERGPAAEQKIETATRYVTVVHEENVFTSDPLLWVLLVLLLLLLIQLRNRSAQSRRPRR